ncbi:MAG TPA: family 78 glycoside hydrolase catalytic domain [Rariglobus sp.]|nr:family 78 glycoside hydrolase catalytic domain [Rariglobus sp.]
MPLRLTDLRTEHLVNPLGLDEPAPRFSWKLADTRTGAAQTAFQLEVSARDAVVWDSHRVDDDSSVLVPYAGPALEPHTRYHWRIRIWDHTGTVSAWSSSAWFETGFLNSAVEWPAAKWIHFPLPATDAARPAGQLSKTFRLAGAPSEARLYITARGIFEPHLNGRRIGQDHLTPGWTDYRHRLEYLTYDVTDQLAAGENTLGALLADGWYAGFLGWKRDRDLYGGPAALFATLRIVEADGSVRWIGTDSSWRGSPSPFTAADIYDGEIFDARLASDNWCTPAASGKKLKSAHELSVSPLPLAGKAFGRVRTTQELNALTLTQPEKGVHVFDLGQNMVGNIRLRIRAPRGTRITLHYAEMLQADGTLYTANLRSAKAADIYICRGGGVEIYEPRFTFHGFRYVGISGLKTKPRLDAVTGLVWHSEMEATGSFTTSHPLVNQLQSNIQWGQRGNFLEVPTDCPQRDERLGWTGDAQVFTPTAAFNYDVAAFFRKWTRDLADGQHPTGAFPDIAPDVFFKLWPDNGGGTAAWGDAGIICPWTVYQKYGDTRILAENYPAMARSVAFQEKTSAALIRPDTHYGDWLAPDASEAGWGATPSDLIGTAYFARITAIMADVARILGHAADAKRFTALHAKILTAFNRRFVTPDGRLTGDTQTAYLLALGFDMLPKKLRPAALANLERALKRRNEHLATGFVGTPLLCPVLSRFGRTDLAYKLLFNEAYPSWFFPIKNGATTMWERWNSWTPSKGFGEVGMNSFNHYAYGAIGEWLYATVAGISELTPGFKRILLRPQPHEKLTHAAATLTSPHGEIRSAWKRTKKTFTWTVTVPPNTTATAAPPCASLDNVRIANKPWREAEGVSSTTHNGLPALTLLPGRYTFTMPV